MYSQKKFHFIKLLLSLTLLFVGNLHAATSAWSITGNLDLIDQDLQPYFSVDDVISGTMVVEERVGCETNDSIAFSCTHSNAVKSLSIKIGAHNFNSNDPSKNGIYSIYNNFNSTEGFLGDEFSLVFSHPESETANFGDLIFSNIQLIYKDSTGNALDSTALPFSPPDATFFELTQLSLVFYQVITTNNGLFESIKIKDSGAISRNLRLNFISTVPEPESYAMLLAGLGLIGFTIRKKN